MARQVIDNPILKSPYAEPGRHWRFDDAGMIVPEVLEGRGASESSIPISQPTKKGKAQAELALVHTVEQRKRNDQVHQIRAEADLWRHRGYPDVTTTSRWLLEEITEPPVADQKLRQAIGLLYADGAITGLPTLSAREGDVWATR